MAVLSTTTQKRNAWIAWLDHCSGRRGEWANPAFFGKTIGGVPEPWADAILTLEMALRATGYTPKSAWAYNFRGISGKPCSCSQYGNCSLHGNGIAIDIDPKLNPYIATSTFRWSDTAFTPAQIAAVEGIRNTKGEQVWFWAGRWSSIKDYMHFEANVDPGSTNIDWSTVPGGQQGGAGMHPPDSYAEFRRDHNSGEIPNWAPWDEYVEAGGTSVPDSGSWPAIRADISWFWYTFVRTLEAGLKSLTARVVKLEKSSGSGGGGLTANEVRAIAREEINRSTNRAG